MLNLVKVLSILTLSVMVAACGDDVKSSNGTGNSNNSSADTGTTPVVDAGFPGRDHEIGLPRIAAVGASASAHRAARQAPLGSAIVL